MKVGDKVFHIRYEDINGGGIETAFKSGHVLMIDGSIISFSDYNFVRHYNKKELSLYTKENLLTAYKQIEDKINNIKSQIILYTKKFLFQNEFNRYIKDVRGMFKNAYEKEHTNEDIINKIKEIAKIHKQMHSIRFDDINNARSVNANYNYNIKKLESLLFKIKEEIFELEVKEEFKWD